MDRVLQVDFRLKLHVWRDTKGFVENIDSVEIYYDGATLDQDDRIVHVTFRVPAELWEAPHIDVDIRSALQGMLDQIRGEAIELEVQR